MSFIDHCDLPPVPEGYEVIPDSVKEIEIRPDDLVFIPVHHEWRHVPNRVGLTRSPQTVIARNMNPKGGDAS